MALSALDSDSLKTTTTSGKIPSQASQFGDDGSYGMPPGIPVISSVPIAQYSLLRDDGTSVLHRPVVSMLQELGQLGTAQIEVLTAIPEGQTEAHYLESGRPTLWVLHGWWGNAAQNLPFLELMASRYGVMTRAVSFEAHGMSQSQPRSWLKGKAVACFGAYVQNLEELLQLSVNEPKTLLLHSGAAHWGQKAFRNIKNHAVILSIKSVFFLAPVPERGTLLSTLRFIRMGVRHACAKGDFEGIHRYFGQFKFWGKKRHLSYLIDSVVTTKHILFDASTSDAFTRSFLPRIDNVFYLEYLRTLSVRSVAPLHIEHRVAPENRHLLRLGNDQNYSEGEHRKTAENWGATFHNIPEVPHHGLALNSGRERIAATLALLLQGDVRNSRREP